MGQFLIFHAVFMKTERVVAEFNKTKEQNKDSKQDHVKPGHPGSIVPTIFKGTSPSQGFLTQEDIQNCFERVLESYSCGSCF